jgi:hypothetical protein
MLQELMKVCIQDSATRKFLCEAKTWVDGVEKALNFATSFDAFRHCAETGLSNVRLLIDRGLSRPPVVIPIETSQLTKRPMTGFPRQDLD